MEKTRGGLSDACTLASRTYDVHHVVESWASNDCASKAQSREAGNETSSFRVSRPPGQKPDALALIGWLGGWIVMPEATKLSVSMIVSLSASLPHCRLSDLNESLSVLSI